MLLFVFQSAVLLFGFATFVKTLEVLRVGEVIKKEMSADGSQPSRSQMNYRAMELSLVARVGVGDICLALSLVGLVVTLFAYGPTVPQAILLGVGLVVGVNVLETRWNPLAAKWLSKPIVPVHRDWMGGVFYMPVSLMLLTVAGVGLLVALRLSR